MDKYFSLFSEYVLKSEGRMESPGTLHSARAHNSSWKFEWKISFRNKLRQKHMLHFLGALLNMKSEYRNWDENSLWAQLSIYTIYTVYKSHTSSFGKWQT